MSQRPRIQHRYTIRETLTDANLLGAALGDPATWVTWLIVLMAAFGLPLNDQQLATFATVAGNRPPPSKRVRELWVVAGRRGGKSRMAAATAVYLAVFVKHKLAAGEKGMVLVLSPTVEQSKVVLNNCRAFLEASPVLRQEIDEVTRGEIRLRNGITLATHASSYRTIRGRTLCACVLDEVAQLRSEESATPDTEVYSAVLPSLLTTKGMLVGISTGSRRVGLLYQKHRDFYGIASDDTLVVQGGTLAFNLSLTEADLAAQQAADPAAAESEWRGGFRDDLASYLDDALVELAVDHARPLELPPRPATFYKAFTDSSGGAINGDAYSLAIGHKENGRFIIDVVRGVVGPFDPQQVTKDFAALCKEYRIGSIVGDNYSREWVAASWRSNNIAYCTSDLPKSELYLETLVLFTRGLVRLPDHPKLLRELRLLERRVHRSGKDTVDHPKGAAGRDDHINAVAGVLRNLSNYLGYSLDAFAPGFVDLDQVGAAAGPPPLSDADANYQHYLLSHGTSRLW